jgi:hypothetical protein
MNGSKPLSIELVDRFAARFAGNLTAHGSDEGGAVREPITQKLVGQHLDGTNGIGIYPIRFKDDDPYVHWGCCDIDTGDWGEAYMLAVALKGMGFVPHIERSRSKGWHIWIFIDGWVPAAMMRRALKMAYLAIDLPAKEANPKQETLRPDQLGNYVRLPYKGGLYSTPERQVMTAGWDRHSDGTPIPFEEFMGIDMQTPMPTIEKWASKWYEPPRHQIQYDGPPADIERVIANMPAKVQRLILQGPKNDRSAAMVALAHRLRDGGAAPNETLSVLLHVDNTWGKHYSERPDGIKYVQDIVERAY